MQKPRLPADRELDPFSFDAHSPARWVPASPKRSSSTPMRNRSGRVCSCYPAAVPDRGAVWSASPRVWEPEQNKEGFG
jgi:hypothetical protein